MSTVGGVLVREALEAEGIPFTFGIPGTHNIELYDALVESETLRPILVTDEQAASFMADGVWRASGRLGCVNLVPGAGLTHALSGIAEAFLDNVPMLVLGCGIRRDTGRAYQLHDVDQEAIVSPVVKGTFRPEDGAGIGPAIREACHLARSGAPGPVFVEIPANLYLLKQEADPIDRGPPPAPDRPTPDPGKVRRAAAILREAGRPLIYAGLGAREARAELRALAERLEAPVATTFQGKGVLPESHPLFLWPGFGNAAPPFARHVAERCQATLAIGCKFGEVATASYGIDPPGPLLHVDVDPEVPGRNFEAVVTCVSDAGAFLRALLDELDDVHREPDAELRERIREGHADFFAEWEEAAGGEGVMPGHLIRTLQEHLGPDAIFTADSGNGMFLAMECLRLEEPGKFLAPVDYSCMGYSVPAAVGAALARPDCPVVALAGDGAFLMTGLEVLTAAREKAPAMIVVLRDRELAQIAQFQETALNRKALSDVADYDLEFLARGFGVPFERIASDEEVGPGIERARRATAGGGPVLVEAVVDYSKRTHFTSGVVKTNLLGLPLPDRLRVLGRAVVRRITG